MRNQKNVAMADIGMDTTIDIIERLKDKIRKKLMIQMKFISALKRSIKIFLKVRKLDYEEANKEDAGYRVNGVGKTTSIGKMQKQSCVRVFRTDL